jgi:hypothetical protein
VTALLADTIPHPAPPAQVADSAAQLRRRAQRGGWPAARSLAVGTLGGLAAVLLPHIVSAEPGTGQAHYAIGGAIGLAGIVGFVAQRPSGPLDAGGHDREALREWRRRMDEIREENADRRKVIRLRIVSGNASTERIP